MVTAAIRPCSLSPAVCSASLLETKQVCSNRSMKREGGDYHSTPPFSSPEPPQRRREGESGNTGTLKGGKEESTPQASKVASERRSQLVTGLATVLLS